MTLFAQKKTILFIISMIFMSVFSTLNSQGEAGKKSDLSYILRANDVVRLSVYEEPDLSGQVRILKTGQASFPLIGSVEIGGKSVATAVEKIRELYAKDYLIDPKLTLMVDDYAVEYVSVIGAVKGPGQIPMPVTGKLDLASAIASAGGIMENADSQNIQLIRDSGVISTYSMAAIQSSAGSVALASGDRIIVNQSAFIGKTVAVLGQVGKPGPVEFPIEGKLDLVNAIALAGGMTQLANPKKVSINRKGTVTVVDFQSISQRGDRPYLLRPDDVVTVAERLF
jgi:polysaccharide biosynthesis/export protein